MCMARFLVLLRAVNVGGKNRVPMAELRAAASQLGYRKIDTYLQSGNLVLSSDTDRSSIQTNIKRCVTERFRVDVTVIVRSADEIMTVVTDFPYQESAPNSSGVVFLDREIELVDSTRRFLPDRFTSAGSNLYVDCPTGFGQTKLSVSWIERTANCRGTRRNWKTVMKLHELLQQI